MAINLMVLLLGTKGYWTTIDDQHRIYLCIEHLIMLRTQRRMLLCWYCGNYIKSMHGADPKTNLDWASHDQLYQYTTQSNRFL